MPGWAKDEPTVKSASVLTWAVPAEPSCASDSNGRRGIGKSTVSLRCVVLGLTLSPQNAFALLDASAICGSESNRRWESTQPIGVCALPS